MFDGFSLIHWSELNIRRRWMAYGQDQLEVFLSWLPESMELPLEQRILDESVQHMADYALRSLDAVHLATALHYNIPVFWTCGDHFRRVDDLAVEIIRDPS